MLMNNIELDVKTKCIEEDKTQNQIAEDVGTSAAYVSRIVNSKENMSTRHLGIFK